MKEMIVRNLFKIIFLSYLFSLECNEHYASSKYEDSVFSICYLRFREPLLPRSNPNKINLKTYIEKRLKRGSFGGFHKKEYKLASMSLGTAFYLGDGRFATNFHFLLDVDPNKGHGHVLIKYKDKVIHLEEGIQHDSISDLLVFHSTSTDLKDLVPLEIGFPKKNLDGAEIAAFDYEYNKNVDLKISLNQTGRLDMGIVEMNIKGGMSGSPVLCQKKVLGIVNSYRLDTKAAYFTPSLNLLILLKSSKVSCNLNKGIHDGLDHLIDEVKNGDENAMEVLQLFLSMKYVKKKYFKDYGRNKIFYILKYIREVFRKFQKDFS